VDLPALGSLQGPRKCRQFIDSREQTTTTNVLGRWRERGDAEHSRSARQREFYATIKGICAHRRLQLTGWTPLHVACINQQSTIAQMLLEMGAEITVKDLVRTAGSTNFAQSLACARAATRHASGLHLRIDCSGKRPCDTIVRARARIQVKLKYYVLRVAWKALSRDLASAALSAVTVSGSS
jgi:hypothetical protein